jgi:hypothetical protein
MMYDLWCWHIRANAVRVTTYMVASGNQQSQLPDISACPTRTTKSRIIQNVPDAIKKNVKIQIYHMGLFAQFLEKMRSTSDGDGSLLDNSIVLFGSNMSNSNLHDHFPCESGYRRGVQGGRHVKYPRSHADDESAC